MSRRILVSGIGRRNALLRLMADECRPYDIEIIGADASPLAAARCEVATFAQLPFANDPGFQEAYAQLLSRHEPLAYLTLLDPEITALGMLATEPPFSEAVFVHPAWTTAEVCEDKFAFFKHLQARGLPAIPTFLSPMDSFPQIRKDRRGSGSSGFCVYPDEGSLPTDQFGDTFVYQPFHADKYFCADVYYSLHSGELIDGCVKEVLYRKGGESLVVRSVPLDSFIDVLRGAGTALTLRGIINFDMFGTQDSHSIMEINCRTGGNYPASHKLGVNLLELALREVVEDAAQTPRISYYKQGVNVSTFPDFI